MIPLDRNASDKLRLRRNAQRMRTADLSGSIALNATGGIYNTATGLAIKLDGTSLTLSANGLKLDVLTAKGDLLTRNATVPDRLPVGSNGQILSADSGETTGLKWIAAASSSPLTTKGDIFGHSTIDDRIPVGTDGDVLTADSGNALGVSWQTPTGGGGGLTSAQVLSRISLGA